MSKLLRSLLVMSIVLATLATMSAQAAQAADPINVRIFVGIGTGDHDEQLAPQQALEKLWNDAHTDIKIKFDINSNKTATDTLLTQVAAGNIPDLVGPIGIKGSNELKQLFEDLTPYLTKDKTALKLDEYDAQTLQLFQQADGKNLSVALGVYPSFFFANEDIFKAAGVALPPKNFGDKYVASDGTSMPWDWNTVALIAQKLTVDSNGKYGDESGFDPSKIAVYGFDNSYSSLREVGNEFGATSAGVDKDGKTATFNQPAYMTAVQWYHDAVYTKHFYPDTSAETALTQGTSPFESNKVAMWDSHTWYFGCCTANARFKWGIYAPPAAPGSTKVVAPLHADTFLMTSGGKNKDAAWTVLKWLNSAEISSQLCAVYGCLPARKSARDVWNAATAKQYPSVDLKLVYAAIPMLDLPSHESDLPNYHEADDALSQAYARVFTDPNLDVTKTLNDLNTVEQNIFQGKFPPTATPMPTAVATAAK